MMAAANGRLDLTHPAKFADNGQQTNLGGLVWWVKPCKVPASLYTCSTVAAAISQ